MASAEQIRRAMEAEAPPDDVEYRAPPVVDVADDESEAPRADADDDAATEGRSADGDDDDEGASRAVDDDASADDEGDDDEEYEDELGLSSDGD